MAKPVKFKPDVVKKADKLIGAYMLGELHARKMHLKGRLSLDVDRRHRLLSLDGGESWELLTHEAYNKKVNRVL